MLNVPINNNTEIRKTMIKLRDIRVPVIHHSDTHESPFPLSI